MRAIELPEHAGLADGEQGLVVADVDQHPLEHFVEVERFGRDVLVMPGK